VLDTALGKFLFRVTDAGREFLIQEGTDQRYGARHLKRAIERYVVYPLANLLATQQVRMGDLVRIDWDGLHKQLTFIREREGAIVAAQSPDETLAVGASMVDGLGETSPANVAAEEIPVIPPLPVAAPASVRQLSQGRKK
jgi:hypothetical protein